MIAETLLDVVGPVRADHPMYVSGPPEQAAAAYQHLVAALDRLDLVHVGLGPDGHMASRVPGSPHLLVKDRRAVSGPAGLEPWVDRVTMTLPTIQAARRIVFLVAGKEKAEAVFKAFEGDITAETPASLARLEPVRVEVFLDRPAAAKLTH